MKEQLFAKVHADDSSSSYTTTDPLDTKEDGTVSALERAAGQLAEVMKTLKQYEQTAANLATQDSARSLSLAA